MARRKTSSRERIALTRAGLRLLQLAIFLVVAAIATLLLEPILKTNIPWFADRELVTPSWIIMAVATAVLFTGIFLGLFAPKNSRARKYAFFSIVFIAGAIALIVHSASFATSGHFINSSLREFTTNLARFAPLSETSSEFVALFISGNICLSIGFYWIIRYLDGISQYVEHFQSMWVAKNAKRMFGWFTVTLAIYLSLLFVPKIESVQQWESATKISDTFAGYSQFALFVMSCFGAACLLALVWLNRSVLKATRSKSADNDWSQNNPGNKKPTGEAWKKRSEVNNTRRDNVDHTDQQTVHQTIDN